MSVNTFFDDIERTPGQGAQATATGGTTTITGSTTMSTTGASGSATGGTTSLSNIGILTTTATANASGGTSILLDTTFDLLTATANSSGETIFLTPNIPTTTANASVTGGQTSLQVLGQPGNITVLIEDTQIETFTNIEVKKRLNEIDTFSFQAFIENSDDRALIQEGNEVKIIEGYSKLLFKGVLNEVEYKSSFRAKCEGNGMVQKLLDRKTDRDTYSNTAGDDIVKSEVPTNIMNYGTIEAAPQVSVRFDHDNLARAVAGVANATGYDWYIDQEFADDFDIDYLNFVDEAGARFTTSTTGAVDEMRSTLQNDFSAKTEGYVFETSFELDAADEIKISVENTDSGEELASKTINYSTAGVKVVNFVENDYSRPINRSERFSIIVESTGSNNTLNYTAASGEAPGDGGRGGT